MTRSPAERAIIYAGVLGGLTREQINNLLPPEVGELPESSYKSLRSSYYRAMIAGINEGITNGMNEFGDMIFNPKRWDELG